MQAPGTIMRVLPGFGEMTVVYHNLPKGRVSKTIAATAPTGVTYSRAPFDLSTMMGEKKKSGLHRSLHRHVIRTR